MQFLKIKQSTKLVDIANVVGNKNVEYLLAVNDLQRKPNIGKQFYDKCKQVIAESSDIDWQRKSTLLNTLTSSSDVFEAASLMNNAGWKILSKLGTLPDTLKIPESISLPDSTELLGNNIPIGRVIYDKAISSLENSPHIIDPGIFNEYSTIKSTKIVEYSSATSNNPFQSFNIPWGDVSLYSSISNTSIDLPCYPEEIDDSRKANYTTMPDLLYTYEPWQVYESSGPRSNPYRIMFHRDMWSGDHKDGKANELIRFFESNCYEDYKGAAVNTPTVTLYIKGRTLISGIMEEVSTNWSGPLLDDGFYAVCELSFTITEVSKRALNYNSIKSMPLIGG